MLLAQSALHQHRNKLNLATANATTPAWYPWSTPAGGGGGASGAVSNAFSSSFIDAMAAASSAPASLQNQATLKDSKDCKFSSKFRKSSQGR